MDPGNRPRDGRRSNHPPHDTDHAEKQNRGEDQLKRAVSRQSTKVYALRIVGQFWRLIQLLILSIWS
jgi:hypothetical protein